jgi:hypothetical protein
VNVDATGDADLFRALKGGANNYGVVNGFDFQTFSQGKILAGFITSPFTQREAVVEAVAGLANPSNYGPYAEIVTAVSYEAGSLWGSIATIAAYTKAETKPAAVQPLINVPKTNSTLHLTLTSTWSNELTIPLTEQMFYTGTYGASAALMSNMIERWDAILKAASPIPGLSSGSFAFEPLPTVYTQWGEKRGCNSLGTTPRGDNAMILLLSPGWNGTRSDALVINTARQLLDGANEVAKGMGFLHDFQYLNYAGPGQNPLTSCGASNLAKLRAASRKYDPHGVF